MSWAFVEPSDRVLVKIVASDGKHKIMHRWETDFSLVHHQPSPDIPVFVNKKKDGNGKSRPLHRIYFFQSALSL